MPGRASAHTCGMQIQEEDVQVRHVIERLAIRYPAVPLAEVERSVFALQVRLEKAPVRAFIPILIENEARDVLLVKQHTLSAQAVRPAA